MSSDGTTDAKATAAHDRAAKAASVLRDNRSDDAPKRFPLFIALVAVLMVVITVSVALSLSGGSPVAQQQNSSQADATKQDSQYGASNANGNSGTYGATDAASVGGATAPPRDKGCAVGYARDTSGACVKISEGAQAQSGGSYSSYSSVQDANSAYANAANAAVTRNQQTGGPNFAQAFIPAPAAPQPKTITVGDPTPTDAGSTNAVGSNADQTGAMLAQMRRQIVAQMGQGGKYEDVGGTTPTQGTPSPTPTPNRDGLLGTPILPPPAYAIPMGTCLDATTEPTLDSSLAGPFYAKVSRDYFDSRNGALVIPATSTVMGHYVGLTGNATHMAVAWDWIEYPDFERRALTASVTAAAPGGENGVPGRINTHLFEQFRNNFFGEVVDAAGRAIQNLTSRATNNTQVSAGNTTYETSPNSEAARPTLYLGRAQKLLLCLAVDYDADHPYTGHHP